MKQKKKMKKNRNIYHHGCVPILFFLAVCLQYIRMKITIPGTTITLKDIPKLTKEVHDDYLDEVYDA